MNVRRSEFLPFSRPDIGEEEVAEVADSLRSGWITTGPKVERFEAAFAADCGAPHAVAVNSGTAALHLIYAALGVGPGDEVLTSPLTFVATANMAVALGARPAFADVDRKTLDVDPDALTAAITPKTKLIVPVHFAGLPCDM